MISVILFEGKEMRGKFCAKESPLQWAAIRRYSGSSLLQMAILTAALIFPIHAAANDNDRGNAQHCVEEPENHGEVACGDYVEPERLIHRNDWDFMEGYQYRYSETCSVAWHPRTAHFLLGEGCSGITNERIKSDALKSIAYVKKHSNAKDFSEYYASLEPTASSHPGAQPNIAPTQVYTLAQANLDARKIWAQACNNFKSMKLEPAYKFFERYPKIEAIHVGRLFKNANDTASGTGGMVNCKEQGNYSADIYTSDIDIRRKK